MNVYEKVARRKANKYGIDPDIFDAQINQESGFDPNAKSGAGAEGVAQIMPGTAAAWNVNPFHPRQALDAAAKHMSDYVHQYGNYADALAAYNGGPGVVGGPLPAETQNYISTILGGRNPQVSASPSASPGAGQQTPTHKATQGPNTSKLWDLIGSLGAQSSDANTLGTQMGGSLDNMLSTNFELLDALHGGGTLSPSSVDESAGNNPRAVTSEQLSNVPGLQGIVDRAKEITSHHYNYEWGGGHDAAGTPTHGEGHGSGSGIGYDCSGAVSKVLGIDPRVSGDFESFGESGEGKHVTIYANATHVLMKINGRIWGTSLQNHGGGAGWVPESYYPPGYFSNFTARHPKGL